MENKASYQFFKADAKYEYVIRNVRTVIVKANSREEAMAKYKAGEIDSVTRDHVDIIGKLYNPERESD